MADGEGNIRKLKCKKCDNVGFECAYDGFYYCTHCNALDDEIVETGVADEDFVDTGAGTGTALYQASHARQVAESHPASHFVPLSQQSSFWSPLFEEPNTTTTTANYNDLDSIIRRIKREEVSYADMVGPTEPQDFGSSGPVKADYEDYHFEVRMKYVMGMQLMIQLQCEALVDKFNVCPLICGVAASIWFRFLASTGVLTQGWADEAIVQSESQELDSKDFQPRAKYRDEPHTLHGQRAIMIWYKLLRQKIPLSSALAISFLACHVVREAILPTDIVKWSIEGKIPYFAAFVEIEKWFGQTSVACSLSPSFMFRPSKSVPSQKLESFAASIAESIGLHLPPVNFYALASHYLKQLCLPVGKILPHALKIQEWSMPPDLWLSTNECRFPTRVCVMSILIVAIRILYNINGFGAWETSLSSRKFFPSTSNLGGKFDPECSAKTRDDVEEISCSPSGGVGDSNAKSSKNQSHFKESELDAEALLYDLEARYNDIRDSVTYEYSKDLSAYLKYCKDVVFAGLEPPHDDPEEAIMIEKFWKFYQNEKKSELAEDSGMRCGNASNRKRSRDDLSLDSHSKESEKKREKEFTTRLSADYESFSGDGYPRQSLNGDNSSKSSEEDPNSEANDEASAETLIDSAIRRLKLDMENNRFCYISPRVQIKRLDYLQYVRKSDGGSLTYAAHADYYILLRACATIAQVDIRSMHMGVLSFERRLAWLEKRIDHCLHLTPPSVTCRFCRDPVEQAAVCNVTEHSADDHIGLSNLNI